MPSANPTLTPNYDLPSPQASDPPDVPGDIKALADKVDELLRKRSGTALAQFPGGYTPATQQWVPIACPITKINLGRGVIQPASDGIQVNEDCLLQVFAGAIFNIDVSFRLEHGPDGHSGDDDDHVFGDTSSARTITGMVFYQASAGQVLKPYVYARQSQPLSRAYIGATVLDLL